MPDHLKAKKTSDMTEEELEICRDIYFSSKIVNGVYCPTPNYGMSDEELDDEQKKSMTMNKLESVL